MGKPISHLLLAKAVDLALAAVKLTQETNTLVIWKRDYPLILPRGLKQQRICETSFFFLDAEQRGSQLFKAVIFKRIVFCHSIMT